jgi:hypothetical protein
MASGIELNPDAGSSVEDYDAIRQVVQLCLEGEATGDVEKLREAFHGDAHSSESLAGERYDVPISVLMDMSASSPAEGGRGRRQHRRAPRGVTDVGVAGRDGSEASVCLLPLARDPVTLSHEPASLQMSDHG